MNRVYEKQRHLRWEQCVSRETQMASGQGGLEDKGVNHGPVLNNREIFLSTQSPDCL